MSFKSKLGFGASTFSYALFLTLLPGQAADTGGVADLCAVSGFNGKIGASGGFYEDDADDGARVQGEAALTMPIGCLLGLQVDVGYGDLAGEGAGGVAGHLFMRDPEQYLLGAYGSYSEVGDNEIYRIGGEGELYLGNISLEALGGFEDSDDFGDDFFTAASVAYYPTENLRLNAGFQHFLDVDAVAAGFEWQVDGLGLPVSLSAHGAVGDNDFATVYGGLTLYFGGEEKSLIRRHREDDPGTAIMKLLRHGDEAVTQLPPGPLPPPPQLPPPPLPPGPPV